MNLAHLIILFVIGIGAVGAFVLGKRGLSIRALLAVVLLGGEVSVTLLAWEEGLWSWRWALPLQLCDLAVFGAVISLFWPVRWIGEVIYFWVIGGTVAAVLTPDLSVAFPSPYYILFFFTHGGAIISVFYLVGFRKIVVDANSIGRVWVITHLYVVLVAIFNWILDTNYLYLCFKPAQFSVVDFLGPWPWYLLGMEVIFVASLFISYAIYRRLPC